jgi:retinal rod rhodopsin-sensitive cGMP 3',5'-cyclic phosphodiesterase subunit delta
MAEVLNENSSQEDVCKSIKEGFKINFMSMKDSTNGNVFWQVDDWNLQDEIKEETLPKELLECKEITREVNFSSKSAIENLELIQNFYLYNELIESSRFFFGFVIPDSTNNWEQVIEAKEDVIPYQILSGNLIVETVFLTNGNVISRNKVKIFYS